MSSTSKPKVNKPLFIYLAITSALIIGVALLKDMTNRAVARIFESKFRHPIERIIQDVRATNSANPDSASWAESELKNIEIARRLDSLSRRLRTSSGSRVDSYDYSIKEQLLSDASKLLDDARANRIASQESLAAVRRRRSGDSTLYDMFRGMRKRKPAPVPPKTSSLPR